MHSSRRNWAERPPADTCRGGRLHQTVSCRKPAGSHPLWQGKHKGNLELNKRDLLLWYFLCDNSLLYVIPDLCINVNSDLQLKYLQLASRCLFLPPPDEGAINPNVGLPTCGRWKLPPSKEAAAGSHGFCRGMKHDRLMVAMWGFKQTAKAVRTNKLFGSVRVSRNKLPNLKYSIDPNIGQGFFRWKLCEKVGSSYNRGLTVDMCCQS